MAMDLGFDETKLGRVSIVVNELCTNILKHAVRGVIIVVSNKESISILAIDKGQGIINVSESLRDGVSTKGTAGTGLGAITRLSDRFDLYTQPEKGTVVLAAFDVSPRKEKNYSVGGFSLPMKNEIVSGDSWTCKPDPINNLLRILVADGLGHGIFAHEASRAAVEEFERYSHENPLIAVSNIHRCLKSSRGAAVGVAYIEFGTESLIYCGLGNISAQLVSAKKKKNLMTYNGTAGLVLRKTNAIPYSMASENTLIMHSDGLSTQWNPAEYSGLIQKDPLIIAGVIFRDAERGTDDVCIVVVKVNL